MTTLPLLLLERAASTPKGVAVRRFQLGAWQETTWAELCAEAAAVGGGLASLGIGRGDVVGIITEDGPEWFAAELGAQGIGATVLGLDCDLSPRTVAGLLRTSGAKAVMVGDQEQHDKAIEARGEDSPLRVVVIIDTRGMRHVDLEHRADESSVLSLAQLRARGTAGGDWEAAARAVRPDDGAVILTTVIGGHLQATRLTHAEAIAHGRALAEQLALGGADVLYTLHAFAEGAEHALGFVGPLVSGATVHFGESGLQAQGLHQVQPTLLCARPAWLAGTVAQVSHQEAATRGIKRFALRRGLRRRAPDTAARTKGHAHPARTAALIAAAVVLLLFLAWPDGDDVTRLLIALGIVVVTCIALVLSGLTVAVPLRRRLGLSRCRGVVMTEQPDALPASLLGALSVPLITPPAAPGTPLQHAAPRPRTASEPHP